MSEKVTEFDPSYRPRSEELDFRQLATDVGRAKLFARRYKNSIFWVPSQACWMVWDDDSSRWLRDNEKSDGLGFRSAHALASEFLDDLSNIAHSERRSLMMDSGGLTQKRIIRDMLDMAKTYLHCPSSHFDRRPRLMGVGNGVVDLVTGSMRDGHQGDMMTLYAPTNYKPDASSQLWSDFLGSVCGGDAEFESFIQMYLGYCLTGSNERENFVILHGHGGTGKSTLGYAILSSLGPYAMTINQDAFSKQQAGRPRDDLAAMDGKRIVLSMELPKGTTLDPAKIKMLSGGDDIWARNLYHTGKEIKQTWSCIVACNYLPYLSEVPDSGWWRRILIVPFYPLTVRKNHTLKSELREDPANRSAILSWLIEGSVNYYRSWEKGVDPFRHLPARIKEATAKYRMQQDHVGLWMDTCLEPDKDAECPNTQLYDSYAEFCDENDIDFPESKEDKSTRDKLTPAVLGRRLSQEGYPASRDRKSRKRAGIRIKTARVSAFDFVEYEQEQLRVASFDFDEEFED